MFAAWTEQEYGAFVGRVSPEQNTSWETLTRVGRQAVGGDFSGADRVAELMRHADPTVASVCLRMLADWGPVSLLYQYLSQLLGDDMMRVYAVASALSQAGRLADAPILFRAVAGTHGNSERNPERIDFSMFLFSILGELDAPQYFSSESEYRAHVAARYHALCDRYGTNLVYLYQGELLDVPALAQGLLTQMTTQEFLAMSALKVVAVNTGMSWAGFFKEGRPQRLTIAASLEDFLHSPRAAEFVPGERRFFGHVVESATAAAEALQPAGLELHRSCLDVDEPFMIFDWAWAASGYSSMPVPYDGAIDFDAKPWFSLAVCLRKARHGLAVPVRALAQAAANSVDSEFVEVASEFVSDLTSGDLAGLWRARIEENDDPEISYLLCAALLRRGYLDDVPMVLTAYRANAEQDDFHYLQLLLNEILWFAPDRSVLRDDPEVGGDYLSRFPFTSVAQCCDKLGERTRQLATAIHHQRLPVFRGEIFSVQSVAQHILELETEERLSVHLRYRFEAATGIDCSTFYVSLEPQLEEAKAVVTDFLASHDARYFQKGRRYFFGHLVD